MTGDWGDGEEAGEQGAGSRGKLFVFFPIPNHQSPMPNAPCPVTNNGKELQSFFTRYFEA
jgi:hypothetical protein